MQGTSRGPRRRTRSIALRVLAGLLIVLTAAGWWVWLRPAVLGGPLSLIAVSGTSMQPMMRTGDLAVVRQTGEYERGEVIAYRATLPDGETGGVVIHRIVGGDAATGFRTRGDNDEWVDPWRPRAGEVVGELWFHVPGAGEFVLWLSRPVILAGIFAAVAAFLVIAGGGAKRERDGPAERDDPAEREAPDSEVRT